MYAPRSKKLKKTIQDELERHSSRRQIWAYAIQQRREGNSRPPPPKLDCIERGASHLHKVKEEESTVS